MNLINYIIRRFFIAILVLLGVITLVFFISRTIMSAETIVLSRLHFPFTEAQYYAEFARLGLDKPVFIQYLIFMGDLLSGDWGLSLIIVRGSSVWSIILQRLPRTIEITILALIISMFIGIKLGKIGASNRNKTKDNVTRIITYLGVSVPAFLLATLFIQITLTTGTKIFPFFGYKSPGIGDPPTITYSRIIDCILTGNYEILLDYLYHLFVPVTAIIIVNLSMFTRLTRSNMLEVLQKDYVRTAWAKGCTKKKVYGKHALKNAVLPTITAISLSIPRIFGGMVVIEVAFLLPGMGSLFYESLTRLDYGIFIVLLYLFGLIAIISNLIADISYAIIDPRIRLT